VQAGRLRLKLAEYYAAEGAADPVQVEMPKGDVLAVVPQQSHRLGENSFGDRAVIRWSRKRASRILDRGGLQWFACHCSCWLHSSPSDGCSAMERRRFAAVARSGEIVPAEFATFWRPFVAAPEEPWVIFSHAKFVGRARDRHAVFRWRPRCCGAGDPRSLHGRRGSARSYTTWTGSSICCIGNSTEARQFVFAGRCQDNDLSFVGSPAENLTLRDIPGTREFVFQYLTSGPRTGDLSVANIHTQAGEANYYIGTPDTSPLSEDYAVIALVKGLDPAHSVLILAGTTTLGTQAAVEFVCDQNSLRRASTADQASDTSGVKPFEAAFTSESGARSAGKEQHCLSTMTR